jgi:2-succinyl-5-enolpyruvyl-6-hydroxy-3-cyclohexene-1-carboxylate synthase
MYTVHKNVQIILALLKKYNIHNLVISAGTRHIPLVFSAENDEFFNCYSIVDERSAGFFALGLIQTTQEPACIICTSGTAACNYASAVNEAYYQHLPLVVLTADRNRHYLNQQEDQCIPQLNLFKDVARKIVDLPIVRDNKDFLYCQRLVNEALLELDHREKGPVHINFQIDDNYPTPLGTFKFELKELPKVIKVNRLMTSDSEAQWKELSVCMMDKKIVIFYGQHLPITKETSDCIQNFCETYGAVIICDHLANLHIRNRIENAAALAAMHTSDWSALMPDIVITMNGQKLVNQKKIMGLWPTSEHWHVSPDGIVSDPFNRLSWLIECPIPYFFQTMIKFCNNRNADYFESWKRMEQIKAPNNPLNMKYEYSAVYAIQGLFRRIPQNALLHISNSNSIRIANMFPIPDGVDCYCNRGTCGIDGSMSSYIAQAKISKRPSFMCIGDLSFFYDMNALWNRYCQANTRIMLCNNSGGALFHSSFYKSVQEFPNIDCHVAAEHKTSAEGWAKSRGFKYLNAHNQQEFDKAIEEFMDCKNTEPVLFEVFTNKDVDASQVVMQANASKSKKQRLLHDIKDSIPTPLKDMISKLWK